MPSWADLNERQQQYMQAIYETDQEQEADERRAWKRGGTPRPAQVWRWIEYGVFDGVGSTLYTKLYLRKLIDEGSTFNALESRGFIPVNIPGSPGILREWYWRAMAEAWKARPAGVKSEYGEDYGHIGWNTWLRLRDFKAGPLIEEYATSGEYLA